jgi:hypothetical protein
MALEIHKRDLFNAFSESLTSELKANFLDNTNFLNNNISLINNLFREHQGENLLSTMPVRIRTKTTVTTIAPTDLIDIFI